MNGAERGARYRAGITSGAIPASVHTQRAVLREPGAPYHFDSARACRAVDFVESLCHVKGRLAGKPLLLTDWQCWLTCEIFGWVDDAGKRCYRSAYVEIPRKNGKTTFAAALGLYMLLADGEAGAECYSAAAHQDQASISFNIARQMVLRNRALRAATGIRIRGGVTYAGLLTTPDGGVFKPLPRDQQGSLDGLNPSFALLDEVHAYRSPDVYDALSLGMGARENPLLFAVTTAGYGLSGVGHSLSKMTKRVLAGELDIPRHFGVIWTYDDGDSVWQEDTWAKANPCLGISFEADYLAAQARIAKTGPEKERAFITKHLNGWLSSDLAWLSMRQYRKCERHIDRAALRGCRAWLALDLASTRDLLGIQLAVVDGGRVHVFGESHAPRKVIEGNSTWLGWQQDGWLVAHDGRGGEAIDEAVILARLTELTHEYHVEALVFDPHESRTLAHLWEQRTGVPTIEFHQSSANFNRPMRAFEAAVAAGDVVIDDDPCTEWQFGNVVSRANMAGHIRPVKDKPDNKIDAAVAALMAFGVAYDTGFDEGAQGAVDLADYMAGDAQVSPIDQRHTDDIVTGAVLRLAA